MIAAGVDFTAIILAAALRGALAGNGAALLGALLPEIEPMMIAPVNRAGE